MRDFMVSWQAVKGFRTKLEAGHFSIGPSIGLKDAVVTDAIAPEADFIWYAGGHDLPRGDVMGLAQGNFLTRWVLVHCVVQV